ncbi:ABC transporter ATP-binding protein [Methanospirillum hungatei]|uniref:ABC transporter ATP-binding protein n=1 Tax=Methanospirillum hungatei TaxID=2203 RepID=UPI0026F222E8|nr:ABC transporter ATP-binding protein [Methanospirillum hungatei]MCA1917342.1 ABC transporter ATP-binding protein [Methanospirillum hungatei]
MGLIHIDKLTIGYKKRKNGERKVISHLNLDMNTGELICLVGPNGSGKSTLLKTITGLLPPLDGEVFLSGRNIRSISSLEQAKLVSMVLTNPVQAGQLTVYDVCSLGRYPHTDWIGSLAQEDHDMITASLDAIGIRHFAHRYLHELSDGERQKVMIARALAQNSKLIILDEPTAFLDMPYRIEIMHILKNLALKEDRGILLSTHDLDLAMRTADRLWVVNRDGSFHDGAPEDLVLKGVISQVFAIGEIAYDAERGRFHIPVHPKGSARITGENGKFRFWTERAMERIGFISQENESAEVHVHIVPTEKCMTWIIQTPGTVKHFSNLTDGIHWIQTLKTAG